jgi:hypothetical protein
MMTSRGRMNGDHPDQDTKETKGTEIVDGAGPPAKWKRSEDSEKSLDLQCGNYELKAALAMVDHGTPRGADAAAGLEDDDEEEGTEEQIKSSNTRGAGRKASPAKSRESRLDQNRKAARESRKRKKVMIEELQRSLIFFSRSNATLKQQNDELTRRLIDAQTTIQALQQQSPSHAPQATTQPVGMEPAPRAAVSSSQAAPTAAVLMSLNGGGPVPSTTTSSTSPAVVDYIHAFVVPHAMQPGSTMQAMSNFQQAAAAAMQAAAQGMQHQAAQQITHLGAAEQGVPPAATGNHGNTTRSPAAPPPRESKNNLTSL